MLHRSHSGYALIVLLLGMLIMGALYASMGRMMAPGGTSGPSPIERSWEATCKANRAVIQAALPMYNMNNEPMKTLDINKLAGIISIPKLPPKCPCKYVFNEKGNVVCKAHP
ncbi:MAG: hypothetical protein WA705_19025 [Candidatus Ozemobacteraceae bacterium]